MLMPAECPERRCSMADISAQNLQDQIITLLEALAQAADSDTADTGEETEALLVRLVALADWPQVQDALWLLLTAGPAGLWPDLVQTIYLLINRGQQFDPIPTIARLHACLEQDDRLDGNLVWTITRHLKGLSYLSDYDPYQDAAVLEELRRLETERPKAPQ